MNNTARTLTITHTTDTRARRGFILPVVLIAAALATALGGALVSAGFHATRSARVSWNGDRALHAADAALAAESQSWTPARIASLDVGNRELSSTTIDGIAIQLSATRTSSSTVLLDAVATTSSGPVTTARRNLSRILHLDANGIPIRAALSVFGEIDPATPPTLLATPMHAGEETSCGLETDTASNAALLTLPPLLIDSTSFAGAPAIRVLTADSLDAFRTALWQRINALPLATESTTGTTTITPTASGSTCTTGTGEPRRNLSAVAACIKHWPARRLASTSGRVTLATSRHQGALIIDGDLELTGHLEMRGLLIVEGTVDTRNGSLDAIGAVIATHHNGGTSRFDHLSTIRYSRCAALRAVTPLATSASPPVLTWIQRY